MRFTRTSNYKIDLPFAEQNRKIEDVSIWRGFDSEEDWEYLRYADSYGYSWNGEAYVDGYDITRGWAKAFWEGRNLILINPERCPNVAVRITFEN